MNEQLLWRMEWMGNGPFSTELIFKSVQQRIHELGPQVDKFNTTFLNIYDQNTRPPQMVEAFKPFVETETNDKNLRFGFNSKQTLEEELRISEDSVQYGNPRYFQQFVRLLDNAHEFKIKVYLAEPLACNSTESIFDIRDAVLLETANNYNEFESM